MLWSFDDVMTFCTSACMSATLLSRNWLIKLFKIFCMELEETKYVKITETIFSEEKRLIWFESRTFLKFHKKKKKCYQFLKETFWNAKHYGILVYSTNPMSGKIIVLERGIVKNTLYQSSCEILLKKVIQR